jgi:hypothetical protein
MKAETIDCKRAGSFDPAFFLPLFIFMIEKYLEKTDNSIPKVAQNLQSVCCALNDRIP